MKLRKKFILTVAFILVVSLLLPTSAMSADIVGEYVSGEVIVVLADTSYVRSLEFYPLYSDDPEASAGDLGPVGPTELIRSQLDLGIDIAKMEIIGPYNQLPNGLYKYGFRDNHFFLITLGDISVPEAVDILAANPNIAVAEPNYITDAIVSGGISPSEPEQMNFTDVSEDDWFYGDVEYAYENGIINGVGDDRFAPNGTLTRAMAVTMLYRLTGEPDVGKVEYQPFDDVPLGEWYTNAVVWAKAHQIAYGFGHLDFGPDKNISRADFSVILVRYAASIHLNMPQTEAVTQELDIFFSDRLQIPEYAELPVWLLSNAGVVNGKDNGAFDSAAPITRAEAAAMLHRFDLCTEPKDSVLFEEYGISIKDVYSVHNNMPYYVGIDDLNGEPEIDPDDIPVPCRAYIIVKLDDYADNIEIFDITMTGQVTFKSRNDGSYYTFDFPFYVQEDWFRADGESLRPLSSNIKKGDILVIEVTITVGEDTESFTYYSLPDFPE